MIFLCSPVLVTVPVAGCALPPPEQTEQEVLRWLDEVPHGEIWGISKWESEVSRARAAEFDMKAWISEGRKIARIEWVLRRMLEEEDYRADLSRLAYALGKVGSAESVPVLIECLDNEDSSVRMQAAAALGELRDPRGVVALGNRLMVAEDEGEISFLISALDAVGTDDARRCLQDAAAEANPVAAELVRTLFEFDEDDSTDSP